MIITITQQGKLKLIDLGKDDVCRVVGFSTEIELFEVLDDLFAIDWIQMASVLFHGRDDWYWQQEFDPEYPFTDYDTFHEWLHRHRCLYKASIASATFDLLKTQFPSFTEENWDRFYNAFLFLNKEGFFTELDIIERREQFYKMFPRVSFLSPFKPIDKDPVEMLSKFVFSSNLEMLVFDIIKDKYVGECEVCSEQELREFCANLVDTLYFNKRRAEELECSYSLQQFVDDYFKKGFLEDIPPATYEHIRLLYHLLTSTDFNGHLCVEFRYNQYEQGRYGQERFPISYFVDADLTERFECKEYIYDCYSKYEITGLHIFNVNKDTNLFLLLGLYASCFSTLSFAKCNTCGHYFVRNTKNKKQVQCNRCKVFVGQFVDVADVLEEAKGIQINSQTAKNRLKAALSDKDSRINEYLQSYDTKQVFDAYCDLIAEYRNRINDVILLLSQEHIRDRYDMIDDYYCVELSDQIAQEKAFIPTSSLQSGRLDFDFKAFYDDYLSPKPFFSYFELLYDAAVDKEEGIRNQAALQLQVTFSKMKSVFLSYGLDVAGIENIEAEFFSLPTCK